MAWRWKLKDRNVVLKLKFLTDRQPINASCIMIEQERKRRYFDKSYQNLMFFQGGINGLLTFIHYYQVKFAVDICHAQLEDGHTFRKILSKRVAT